MFLINVLFSRTWEVGFGAKLRYISMPLHNTCAVMTGNCYVSLQAVIERWQYSNISTDGHTFGFHDESSHLNMSVKKRSLLPHVQPLFLPGLLISECRILNQHGSAQGYNETSDLTRRLTKHNI